MILLIFFCTLYIIIPVYEQVQSPITLPGDGVITELGVLLMLMIIKYLHNGFDRNMIITILLRTQDHDTLNKML